MALTITDVKTILTAPQGTPLIIVKVLTSEPGRTGLAARPIPSAM